METMSPTAIAEYVQNTQETIHELESTIAPLEVAHHPAAEKLRGLVGKLKVNLTTFSKNQANQHQGQHQGNDQNGR